MQQHMNKCTTDPTTRWQDSYLTKSFFKKRENVEMKSASKKEFSPFLMHIFIP